jgi:hypothetical protein
MFASLWEKTKKAEPESPAFLPIAPGALGNAVCNKQGGILNLTRIE